jgi:hypothetical protein
MATVVFNIAKGALVEKFRDGAANGLVILLEAVEADSALPDYDNVDALLAAAGNTEATATGYARKTGITGTIVIDDINERVDVDLPNQTWNAVTGNNIVALIVAYEESASDTGRIPLVKHDFAMTVDGTDLRAKFP